MTSRAELLTEPAGVKESYRKNGFLVVRDGLSAEEISALRAETVALCRGDRGPIHNIEKAHASLDANGNLAHVPDDDVIRSVLCIHQAHRTSDLLYRMLSHAVIVDVLTKIIGPNVKCMQSMLFIKASGKPGQAWHQDEDFIPTRDRSLAGAWMALDDATTIDNGCLWVIPGSHSHGVLWPQYPHNDSRFDCAVESFDFPYTDNDAVPVEVPAGAIVFFNGYLLHRSLPNRRKTGFRRALVNHYMSAESLLPWRYDSEKPMAKQDYRGVVLVAGRDPYAYKGVLSGDIPHIRPSGEGGCGDGRMSLADFKAAGMPKKNML